MEFRQKWDGTAAGATPIIDWILQCGGTARYHDEADGPGARTEIVVDVPGGSIAILPGKLFTLHFGTAALVEQTQAAVDRATANPGRTVIVGEHGPEISR